jgi:hypothetical protein
VLCLLGWLCTIYQSIKPLFNSSTLDDGLLNSIPFIKRTRRSPQEFVMVL